MTFRLAQRCAVLSLCALVGGLTAAAQDIHGGGIHFYPGNIVVSRSVYDNKASNVVVGTLLPPNCPSTAKGCGTAPGAPNDGTYPYVWNNDIYDGSFGITSKIFLDQMTPLGFPVNTLQVPNSSMFKIGSESDQLVTSFSSKSELALHLSTDGKYITFMGYVAPIDTIDVSNSNTPAIVDPTNPVGENFFRAVAQVDAAGNFQFTETNSYSGNNGRAAILNSTDNVFYTAGNAGNGGKTQPDGVIAGAGAQFIEPSVLPEGQQTPGMPTPVGSFSVTQLGAPADKVGKDDNFRGVTIFNNVVYFAKGSGGNGVNTVYFIDTVGTACPNGVGLPVPGASLPATPLTYDPATLQTNGLPSNMCILAGFPISSNKAVDPTHFPFGLWFADANTLYLADEGDGYADASDLYTHAAAQTTAGLGKMGFRFHDANLESRIYPAEWAESRKAVHDQELPDGKQCRYGTPLGSGAGWTAQHRGQGGWLRLGDDLGHHLDGERQRGYGRRSESTRGYYGRAEERQSEGGVVRAILYAAHSPVRRGVARSIAHTQRGLSLP